MQTKKLYRNFKNGIDFIENSIILVNVLNEISKMIFDKSLMNFV